MNKFLMTAVTLLSLASFAQSQSETPCPGNWIAASIGQLTSTNELTTSNNPKAKVRVTINNFRYRQTRSEGLAFCVHTHVSVVNGTKTDTLSEGDHLLYPNQVEPIQLPETLARNSGIKLSALELGMEIKTQQQSPRFTLMSDLIIHEPDLVKKHGFIVNRTTTFTYFNK